MEKTVEVVSFKVRAGKASSMVAGRSAAVEALRVSAPGLVSATLAELGGDEWLDIMIWETAEQARAAEDIAAATPAFARWGEEHVASIGTRYHSYATRSSDSPCASFRSRPTPRTALRRSCSRSSRIWARSRGGAS
jgi:hypothetical protein